MIVVEEINKEVSTIVDRTMTGRTTIDLTTIGIKIEITIDLISTMVQDPTTAQDPTMAQVTVLVRTITRDQDLTMVQDPIMAHPIPTQPINREIIF